MTFEELFSSVTPPGLDMDSCKRFYRIINNKMIPFDESAYNKCSLERVLKFHPEFEEDILQKLSLEENIRWKLDALNSKHVFFILNNVSRRRFYEPSVRLYYLGKEKLPTISISY